MNPKAKKLRELLARKDRVLSVLHPPTAALARIMERGGCEAGFVGTSAVVGGITGLADVGTASMTECVQIGKWIAQSVAFPVILDGDTGHGGIMAVRRLVRECIDAGIAGIRLDDQPIEGKRRTQSAGIEIVARGDDPAIEAYETAHGRTPQLWSALYRYEMHWPMLQYRERFRDKLPPRLLKGIEDGMDITQETYRAALIERESFRTMHGDLAWRVDGFITLSSPGPGPIGMDQGSAIFNEASSVLGVPAINLPLLSVDDAPLGVQLLGAAHGDERLTAIARWIAEQHCRKPN